MSSLVFWLLLPALVENALRVDASTQIPSRPPGEEPFILFLFSFWSYRRIEQPPTGRQRRVLPGKMHTHLKKAKEEEKNHWSSAQRHSLFLQTPLGIPGYTTGHNDLHFCAALLPLTAAPTWHWKDSFQLCLPRHIRVRG